MSFIPLLSHDNLIDLIFNHGLLSCFDNEMALADKYSVFEVLESLISSLCDDKLWK